MEGERKSEVKVKIKVKVKVKVKVQNVRGKSRVLFSWFVWSIFFFFVILFSDFIFIFSFNFLMISLLILTCFSPFLPACLFPHYCGSTPQNWPVLLLGPGRAHKL